MTGMQRDAITIATRSLELDLLRLATELDTGKDANGFPTASVPTLFLEIDDKTNALIVLHEMVGVHKEI